MKHTATKFIAMILATLMVVALAVPMVSATTGEQTASVTYPTYAEAKDGDLLYEVDFSGTDGRYTPAIKAGDTSQTSFAADANDNTKVYFTADPTANTGSAFGGPVSGLPMNKDSVYTIDFTMVKSANLGWGTFFYADSGMDKGFAFANNQSAVSKDFSRSWTTYSACGIGSTVSGKTVNGETNYNYRVVIDAPNRIMRLLVLDNAGCWAAVMTNDSFTVDVEENLNIIFGSLTKDVGFVDVKIYKGHADGCITVDRPGELLLEMGDFTMEQTGNYGVTYTPNLDHYNHLAYNYSYDEETDIHTITTPENLNGKTGSMHGFGGDTNLRLGYGQKYTIIYNVKIPSTTNGIGIRYSHAGTYSSAQGSYVGSGGYIGISHGGNAGVNGSTVNTQANFNIQQYNEIAVEIDGYNVKAYVNGVERISYSSFDHNKANATKGFSSDVLAVAMVNYDGSLVSSAYIGEYKNIKVYSGLVMSNNSIEVTDGGVTETVEIEGSTYTLPSKTKAGFVFNGWKVNGAEEITAPGTTLTTHHINTLEAVYTEAMSENFFQFRTGEEGKKDIRVLSVIDSLKYEGIGYTVVMKFTVGGEEKTITEVKALKNVYESVTAAYGNGTEVYTLDKLGFDKDGGYFTSFVIKNVPAALGTLTVELTPYQIGKGETEATEGDTVVYSIDLVNETVVIE